METNDAEQATAAVEPAAVPSADQAAPETTGALAAADPSSEHAEAPTASQPAVEAAEAVEVAKPIAEACETRAAELRDAVRILDARDTNIAGYMRLGAKTCGWLTPDKIEAAVGRAARVLLGLE